MKIKICGIKRAEDVEILNRLKPDYVGFVFAKSTRQVAKETAKMLRELLDKEIQTVGVFVNHNIKEIENLLEEQIINIVQFHANETEIDILNLKMKFPKTKIIKAISVNTKEDILKWENSVCDFLLLDNGKGGTGEKFNWTILNELNIKKDFFIAGGLNDSNVKDVLIYRPYAVDVSGGVECNGFKDKDEIEKFINNVRSYHE